MKRRIMMKWMVCSVAISIAASIPCFGSKAVIGGIEWNFTAKNGMATIDNIPSDTAGVLRIPSEINHHKVTHIGSYAFYRCSKLTSVTIPDTVVGIGKKAFAGCTSLRRVIVSGNIKSIAPDAFQGCDRLEKVPVANSKINNSPQHGIDSSEGGNVARAGALYMVIDLSGGLDTEKFPITWLNAEPDGGWTDEYKTTKLVLRRISEGSFMMGSPDDECGHSYNETRHKVTLTKPFYIGVFEVTQKQYALVTGRTGGSNYRGDMRPVGEISWDTIRGNRFDYDWPTIKNVDPATFMGIIRAKTNISTFDLPTEAQWEYSCRAGTMTSLNSRREISSEHKSDELAELGRYRFNGGSNELQSDGKGGYDSNYTTVGSYKPNMWGLYDMHGNVREWCLDKYGSLGRDAVIDPVGSQSENPDSSRVVKGGGSNSYARNCRSAYRESCSPSGYYNSQGFRLCCDATSFGGGKLPAGGIQNSNNTASSGKTGGGITGFSLSVGQPKVSKRRAPRMNDSSGYTTYYSSDTSKIMVQVSEYKGKVSCNVPKDSTEDIVVEAYFITRPIGEGSEERIEKETVIGTFTFGGNKPKTQTFEFESPEVTERKSTSSYSSYYGGGYRQTDRHGTRYLGCIVRALHEGRILKVVTVPSNQKWQEAGKKKVVELD